MEPVDWKAGEKIVIASTSFDHNESEVRIITTVSADKKTLTLDSPLKYRHYSEVEDYNGTPFPMRAEVGLLTRNILFRGLEEETAVDEHGAHMMLHLSKCIGRVS